eukprot:scaffold319532_cov28-Tisochrysis_lutea.AAC.4
MVDCRCMPGVPTPEARPSSSLTKETRGRDPGAPLGGSPALRNVGLGREMDGEDAARPAPVGVMRLTFFSAASRVVREVQSRSRQKHVHVTSQNTKGTLKGTGTTYWTRYPFTFSTRLIMNSSSDLPFTAVYVSLNMAISRFVMRTKAMSR